MATLTIKNVPEPLVRRLKSQAARHRRSLNREVIACLEVVAQPVVVEATEALQRIRALRRVPRHGRLTDRVLNRLKTAGRL
jgi:plasmid stability protein